MASAQRKELVPVGFRIPADVRDWLNAEAAKQERSANWVLNKMLSDAMSHRQQEAHAKSTA